MSSNRAASAVGSLGPGSIEFRQFVIENVPLKVVDCHRPNHNNSGPTRLDVNASNLFRQKPLLGDSDTRRAWEGLSSEEQEFIRDRYPTEFAAIQERLKEEAGDDATHQS